ncbi:McrB family protein [Nitratiruptor tergarcus]|uniref:5-methylcytosine-specific restriction enzyme B n=1 Tax=Nitratiruptor tergarcus DSM 16512 TaxID=1069081 RepID=A0A1W1WRR8_9BACT|nr:AAA family ATPase [Nitratiruptor tergarcus]SMC08413.1 5-methylcytosine-specific restriction enzyme B [Nitratiruptor tergarcus DSM 16512]
MSNIKQIVKDLQYILEISKEFKKLYEDDNYVILKLNELSKDELEQIKNYYEKKDKEKVNKLRLEIANLLLEKHKITKEIIEKKKNDIQKLYDTNVFKSWKSLFRIFYTFFYIPIKNDVLTKLENIASFIKNNLSIKDLLKIKIQDFNGDRNQGAYGCWIALYNKCHQSHTDAIQLFLNVYIDKFNYGVCDQPNEKDLTDIKELDSKNFTEKNIEKIIVFFEKNKNYVVNDNCDEKNQNLDNKKTNQPLNQIFYGPPGTGKTYNTINKALEIIDGSVPENRKEAKERFDKYIKSGQIQFVTFHQSYGYEDFVEGIKAETDENGDIRYKVENGIFKKICTKANTEIFYIGQRIGRYEIVSLSDELMKLKRDKGSIIPVPMYLLNDLLSLVDKKQISIEEIKNKEAIEKMSTESEKYIINGYANVFAELAKFYLENKKNKNEEKNFVIIIDEINRGNISKIFGELITLIEENKRLGNDEKLPITLPYSQESFSVPKNLYIIGTMNTADRSIALLDTALRRRFTFVEMMPKPEKLEVMKDKKTGIEINLQEMLKRMNERIEYLYDRDHTIGHSYLMNINDFSDLKDVFKNKIIPLLAEYFYDDWAKIRLVLADNQVDKEEYQFIKKKNDLAKELFGDKETDDLDEDKVIYEINEKAFEDPKSYIKIYDRNIENEK